MSKNETYCSITHTSIQIKPKGVVYPCNRYLFPGPNIPPNSLNANQYSPEEILKSNPALKEIRTNQDSGIRDAGCKKCYEEEDAKKGKSIRTVYNENAHILDGFNKEDVELRWIEFANSNICNLKCRMCTPFLSHGLKKEWEDVLGKSSPHWGLHRANELDLEKFLSPSLRHIKFTGGEPFLIPEYKELLRLITRKLDPSKIFLNYSTNATVSPDSEMIELWKQFKYVEFTLSIDGTKDYIEYQRYPTKWQSIEENTKLFLELHSEFDARVGNRATFTIYNILNLREMTDWWIQMVNDYGKRPFHDHSWFNPTHAHIPGHLSITCLPKETKAIIREYLRRAPSKYSIVNRNRNHFVEYMDSEENQDRLPEFRRFTKLLDKSRSQSFGDLCPPLSHLLEED